MEQHAQNQGQVVVGEAVSIVTGALDEIGAALLRLNPQAMKTIAQTVVPAKTSALQQLAARAPAAQPAISLLQPVLNKAASVAENAAKSAAIARRVKATADRLEMPTHVIPVCIDALGNGSTNTAEISAPHSGHPWRYLGLFGASTASVGTRISSFSLAGVDHVVTDNVEYGSAPTSPGIDFALLAGSNQLAANLPTFRWRPWGLRESGIIRPDGKINITVANRSGASAYIFLALLVQSSPCGEGSMYETGKGGVYAYNDRAAQQFMQKIRNFSYFG